MRPRLAYIVTHPATASILLRGQLRFMREHGFEVTVIASPGPELELVREREGVCTIEVPMSRNVRLGEGPGALVGMMRAIRKARPHIVNASTPKGALLGLLSARTLGVPLRIYLLRGLRLQGTQGFARTVLGVAERTSVACAHHVVCVSESLRTTFVDSGFARLDGTSVLASNGIDVTRFRARHELREAAADVRRQLRIPEGAPVVGFVGRLVADKGVADMITAMERVAASGLEAYFLVVGGDLAGDSLPPQLARRLEAMPRVIFAGRVEEPAPYYAAMDVLLFPSYREGLPNVPLEAAACEVPTVGYRTTGVVDAVVDGVTGELVERGNAAALGDALAAYLTGRERRDIEGRAGRERVLAQFTNEKTWEGWLDLYDRLRRERGLTR